MPTALVTGASSGIGRAVAEALAARGFEVVVSARSRARLSPVAARIESAGGHARVLEMDLSSLHSVGASALRLREEGLGIDVLVNNAGVGINRRGLTADGFEARFGINHLGHFMLTGLLAGALEKGGRVVTVASEAHRSAPGIDFDRVRRHGGLIGFREYAVSKLANILFTRELARRHPRLAVYAVHPGMVDTGIIPAPAKPLLRGRLLTPAQGADTVIWCALELEDGSGGYYSGRAEIVPSSPARDHRLAAELWERSQDWTGGFGDGG